MKRNGLWSAGFLGLAVAATALPILWTGLVAVGIHPETLQSPPIWTVAPSLQNFIDIRVEQTFFWQEVVTSLLVALASTALTGVVSLLAAYSLVRARFRGRELLLQSLLILAALPAIAYVMPLREIMLRLRLLDTFVGVVVAETALLSPLATYVLCGYIRQVSPELEDSARLDGATTLSVIIRVVLPAALVGVIATLIVVFVLGWNQFVLPLMMTGTRVRVIPVMMRDFFALEREFEWRIAAAVIIISLLPPAVLIALAHRILERFSMPLNTG